MTELRDQLQGTLGAAYSLERELGGGMSHVFVSPRWAASVPARNPGLRSFLA